MSQVMILEKTYTSIEHASIPPPPQTPLEDQKRSIFFHLKTLYLFTKSDFKTVVFPQSIFAIASALSAAQLTEAGPLNLQEVALRAPLMIVWVWLNLLVENISNQRPKDAIVEDMVNKPWRPLCAGRLSREEARQWLLAAIPLAVGSGMLLGAFKPSICLMILVWMYNDLEGSSSDIWLRNALNAGGLMCFSWGALSVMAGSGASSIVAALPTTILSPTSAPSTSPSFTWGIAPSTSHDGELMWRAYSWILVTGAVIMTTVHAQDMPDMEGDAARGRKTVPLLYGEGWARGSLAVMVLFWSVVCPGLWSSMPWWAWIAPMTIGCSISVLTLLRRGQPADEVAWKLWCLWAASLYLLPLFSGMPTMI